MDPWFSFIAAETQLSSAERRGLLDDGFVVIRGPVREAAMAELAAAYDRAVCEADAADVVVGSSTTRVIDFVNRDAKFDALYLYPPLLEACCFVIERPFKLSTMHARTLRPRTVAQKLHVDFPSDDNGWPMVGFILMMDEFRPDNGATRFAPGSQGAETVPDAGCFVPVRGTPGSLIVFNGSIWHGHGPNETDRPRRSIQGAYIRRTEVSGADLSARMRPETLDRVSPLAKYVLDI